MQVTQTHAEGLTRQFRVVVPAEQIDNATNARLEQIGQTANLPGFRPGKVPMQVLRQRYGASVMGEVLEQVVTETSQKAIEDAGGRPALQPKIEVESFQEGGDLTYTMAFEQIPDIEPVDFATLEIDRLKAEVPDEAVDETIERLAKQRRNTQPAPEGHAAAEGDVAVIDFVGKLDGEAFEGGTAEGYSLELGSGSFIEGFEPQLVGAKAGETREIQVTFPAEYHAENLAGKPVTFDVTVQEVRVPEATAIDDELAKAFGMDSLDALRAAIREQLGQEYDKAAWQHLKKGLFDRLSDLHDFDLPPTMVDEEFETIWKQVQADKEAGRLDEADAAKDEDALKAEYREIAERRVRLGLLMAEVARRHNIAVGEDELTRAAIEEARRFPGQEKEALEFFRTNPEARSRLQAPLFEDKVVTYIVEMAKVTETPVSVEELRSRIEA